MTDNKENPSVHWQLSGHGIYEKKSVLPSTQHGRGLQDNSGLGPLRVGGDITTDKGVTWVPYEDPSQAMDGEVTGNTATRLGINFFLFLTRNFPGLLYMLWQKGFRLPVLFFKSGTQPTQPYGLVYTTE